MQTDPICQYLRCAFRPLFRPHSPRVLIISSCQTGSGLDITHRTERGTLAQEQTVIRWQPPTQCGSVVSADDRRKDTGSGWPATFNSKAVSLPYRPVSGIIFQVQQVLTYTQFPRTNHHVPHVWL